MILKQGLREGESSTTIVSLWLWHWPTPDRIFLGGTKKSKNGNYGKCGVEIITRLRDTRPEPGGFLNG